MNRNRAVALVIAVTATSILVAAGVVVAVGSEPVRQALRWMFAPALFLMGMAGNMLGKVHELAELKGVSPASIPKFVKMTRTVQIRLWLIIALAGIPSLVGPVLSALGGVGERGWMAFCVGATLSAAIASLLYAAIYLPWLYSDFSSVRMQAAQRAKEDERRELLLKSLEEGAKRRPQSGK